jgi:acetyltransferase
MKKPLTTDPAHDVLKYERHPLDAFFRPETVADVGATEEVGSVGRALMWNLTRSRLGGRSSLSTRESSKRISTFSRLCDSRS